MQNDRYKKGISLIVLIISIIVMIILSGIIILNIKNKNFIDNATKAKFFSDYKNVEEAVNIYSTNSYLGKSIKEYPDGGKLTLQDKEYISINNPTLKAKILEDNQSETKLDNINLHWLNEKDLGVNGISEKNEEGYIINEKTLKIYYYAGVYIDNLMWHTVDNGIPPMESNIRDLNVTFNPNGSNSTINKASTKVTINDKNINMNSLKYMWSTGAGMPDNSTWTTFENGQTIDKNDDS